MTHAKANGIGAISRKQTPFKIKMLTNLLKNKKVNKSFISWKSYVFGVKGDQSINNKLLKTAIDNFFNVRTKELGEDKHIAVLVRIAAPGNPEDIRTLTYLTKINTSDKDKSYLFDLCKSSLEFKQGGYSDITINKIYFDYGIYKGKTNVNYNNSKPNFHANVVKGNYSKYKIPVISPSTMY